MREKRLKFLRTVVAIAIAMSFGCGGTQKFEQDEWNGPTVPIRISASANTEGLYITADGNLAVKDASDTTQGSGDGADGIDSIKDLAYADCLFELAVPDTTDNGYTPIRLVQEGEACTDPSYSQNNCIECDISPEGSSCSISCIGTIPSNALAASDSITLRFYGISSFHSQMPAPDGAVRFDALLTDWPTFNPVEDLTYNIDDCDNNAGTGDPKLEMGITVDTSDGGGPNSDNATTTSGWNHTFDITALGDLDPEDYKCEVMAILEETYPFTGADSGGWSLDITGGTIEFYGQICDISSNCDGPQWAVDWTNEAAQLVHVTPRANSRLGETVDIDGDYAIVGAIENTYLENNTYIGTYAGTASIWYRDGGNWTMVKQLWSDADGDDIYESADYASGDRFGSSVAIDGDYIVIGARTDGYGTGDPLPSSQGSAYVLHKDKGGTDNWGIVAKLVPSDGTSADYFGYSIDISGNHIIVGAENYDGGGVASGAAYIFRDDGPSNNDPDDDNWVQVGGAITGSDSQVGDDFGSSVTIFGNYAAVGAPGEDGGAGDPETVAGAVYIFEKDYGGTNNWGEVAKIVGSNTDASDRFGWSVSGYETYLAVGAFFASNGSVDAGAAYIFEKDQGGTDNWGEQDYVVASDGIVNDRFGQSVSIYGDYLAVGAHYDDDNGNNSGVGFIFKKNGSVWEEQNKMIGSNTGVDDHLGYSVGISADNAILGAPFRVSSDEVGGVYIFGN